ncbi:PREDICTED: methyl-CpG-binding domain-containing protein 2-like isoform X1 [Lupinus angustifolius]|nr:PREDICTED: methyl-CpG-binding domain-containing protein 2-like isoform X1 [Lupinus angustifolius]XP_019447599.1 PREDICTED: methyl-CpG-binding domain-containing protein 2-like isoform X1 [Lupinus angustifolius]XP_019447600.1 PREDICTED: methyl-CpG-binding domain-containing protein 2-like isoform X1 [Lupinus angustifolius]
MKNQMHRSNNEVKNLTGLTLPSYKHSSTPDPIYISSSDDESDISKQLVVYDPVANGNNAIQLFPAPLQCEPPPIRRSKVLPSVGAFTVQCASCFKWRLIPTKNIYEEIRECITEQPFVCQKAREWRPDVSCDDPEDISQDGNRIWAIDKPNISKPPKGWERLTRIRSEGSSKFADIYYVAPSGKRLRSMVEINNYLLEHPEYMSDGVDLSKFSFQIPKPLQENYVRKRPAKLASPHEGSGPEQGHPLAWTNPELHDRRLELPAPPCMEPDVSDPLSRPVKKQATNKVLTEKEQQSKKIISSEVKTEVP